jgi:hypothetical protein
VGAPAVFLAYAVRAKSRSRAIVRSHDTSREKAFGFAEVFPVLEKTVFV